MPFRGMSFKNVLTTDESPIARERIGRAARLRTRARHFMNGRSMGDLTRSFCKDSTAPGTGLCRWVFFRIPEKPSLGDSSVAKCDDLQGYP
jgi:hypothetical protein